MSTDFLNDARREIEGRTGDFYEELREFYRGNEAAEQHLMEQTTQPFWQSLRLSKKRLQQHDLTMEMEMQETQPIADYEGPKKDGYDYICQRTAPVKMKRTYYRHGNKTAYMKEPEISTASFLKADVQGDMAVCPNCGHEGKLSSYIDGCDACGAKFLVSDFETKVSGFSLEEDSRQKSISNFIKAGVTVGITAVAFVLLAICAGGIMFLLLALGRNGFNAAKAAAAMMVGIGLAPVFFHSLFFMLIIFIVMIIAMEVHRKPRVQEESKVKAQIPTFSTGDFLQNLEYQLRMIHLADRGEQVRFFTTCEPDSLIAKYRNVVDCCICGVRFLEVQKTEDGYRLRVEVKERLTLDTGRKIRNRYEKVQLELEGRREIAEGSNKPLREYKCPNCGNSVDILGGGVCEYCNTTVDYRSFGWIITSYTNLGRPENPYAGILAGALGIYVLILLVNLAITVHSEDGKETLEIWQQILTADDYLNSVYDDMIYPDDVDTSCRKISDGEDNRFSRIEEFACTDREAVKRAYQEALLEKGFLEMQWYPTGFSVYKIEQFEEETGDPELLLEVRTEDTEAGLRVTVTFLDEDWEPLQN